MFGLNDWSGNGKEFNATADAELLRKAMDRLGLCFESYFLRSKVFFKENVRYPVWTCRDPISLILGTR